MSGISLTASMRSNLLSLKNTSSLIDMTQNRLSTGNKVNSAIDNPSSYYTARSLNNRANDLSSLLDSMGQAVSTIKAASETLESGLAFLEQATAIAEQARTETVSKTLTQNEEELRAEGYDIITSDMNAAAIEAKLTAGAKVALVGDISLDRGLNITSAGVEINGNGHTINYSASTAGESVIKVNGAGSTANIKNISINASGEQLYGISATNGGKITLDNANNIKVSGTGAQKIWFRDENLYNGKANTAALLSEIGVDALAATACDQFYVGDKNGDFGQTKWYLPAIGELMNVYGYDTTLITDGRGTTGADPEYKNKTAINNALSTLASKGAEAATLTEERDYWSSSEGGSDASWVLSMSAGSRSNYDRLNGYCVRSFQLLENCFNPLTLSADALGGSGSSAAPKVGQVMYADKTWGNAADYKNDGSMTAVGVITEVLDDGSVKIMSLKDLTFSSTGTVGNFDPENPYGGSEAYTYHTTSAKYRQDMAGIQNYDSTAILNAFKSSGDVKINFTSETMEIDSSFTEQYNAVVAQYDALMNDGSYKGVNLLKNESLSVRFNENGSSVLNITGKDMSSITIGLTTANWTSVSDVDTSVTQLKNAINMVRTFSTELGNNYSIVQTREDFTENLINVLTEGADKLTLADMNEESANVLALQTRQQLAINSLSLAAQAAQAVLKLF